MSFSSLMKNFWWNVRFCHKLHWRRKPQFCFPIHEAPLHEKMRGCPITKELFSSSATQTPAAAGGYLMPHASFQNVGWGASSVHHRRTLPHSAYSNTTASVAQSLPALSIPDPGKVPYTTCPQPRCVAAKPSCNTCACAHCLESNGKRPSCWMQSALTNTDHICTSTILHIYTYAFLHVHGYF